MLEKFAVQNSGAMLLEDSRLYSSSQFLRQTAVRFISTAIHFPILSARREELILLCFSQSFSSPRRPIWLVPPFVYLPGAFHVRRLLLPLCVAACLVF